MEIRKYNESDVPAMVRIWNEVVEEGVAFPQEEFLDERSGRAFFAAQSYCGVAVADGRYAACCCRPRILIWLGPDSRMTVWPQRFCRNRLFAGSVIPR